MAINWLDWLGYLASLIVLISLTMSSIIKLRWINLVGSTLFSIYGFMIGSVPTGAMNAGIAIINIVFMYRIYTTSEQFKLLQAKTDSNYFNHLLEVNRADIATFHPTWSLSEQSDVFYMLRNNHTAGLLAGHPSETDQHTFVIELDYVTPTYRDFKLGRHFFDKQPQALIEMGYRKLATYSQTPAHISYLKKIGFQEMSQGYFEKTLL